MKNAIGSTVNYWDDTSFSVFQSVQSPTSQVLICGNIFLGLQGYIAIRLPLAEGPDPRSLARGGTVINDAIVPTLKLRAAGNWSAGGAISISMQLDDSPRLGPQDLNLAWKKPEGSGPSWRRDRWGVFDTRIEDTGGAPFLDQGIGTVQWGMSVLPGLREELGAMFVVPAGPPWSVARIINKMSRFGNPIGSTECAIQANTLNAIGRNQPSGIDIAVSSSILNSTFAPSPGGGDITFPFAPNVVLAPGSYWVVQRPDVPYVADFANWVNWMQKRQFFGVEGAHKQGLAQWGVGFDQANYPGHVDVYFDTVAKELPAIIWSPPAASFGDTVETPDLSTLIQEVITTSGHEATSAVCFTFKTVGETRTYRFASNEHATLAPPETHIQYKARYARTDGAL